MSLMVKDNLERAQQKQKLWYDQNALQGELKLGDVVLVLLPTSGSSLTAQWMSSVQSQQYHLYVDMHDTRKRTSTFHISMPLVPASTHE